MSTGADLGPYTGRGLFHMDETNFMVKAGETYEIFGMSVFNDGLLVLVPHETWRPLSLPHELFTIEPSRVPHGWHFAVHGPKAMTEGRWMAEWGYEQFVGTLEASEALAEAGSKDTLLAFHEAIRERADPPPAYERVASNPDRWLRGAYRRPADRLLGPYDDSALFFADGGRSSLSPGRSYEIFGMAFVAARLIVLVEDESGAPLWVPHEHFAFEPASLPEHWYCAVQDTDPAGSRPEAVWGYEELVHSAEHFAGLAEHTDSATAAFRREVASRRANE